ncbi:hypothetical protein CERZMDRAFT_96059 [Cercospora zeae-maydis SCOH1-5]|uniref:O-acyltransferase n=1 Tax=Cercospora zeae-maydis SCOH1-5 TaxID=717836 RepID=A0A6A6FKQ4_9PEZI|nr:hypothetical protein CERZMDRAFT_96059 [Cercospora zeae-maydis SCOH1-5]
MASATSTAVQVHVADGHVAQVNGLVPQPNGSTEQSNGGIALKITALERSTSRDPRSASRKYKHTFAVHAKPRPSVFSADAPSSPSTRGFRNLMALVIITSNLRLMIDNYSKYGPLVALSGGASVKEGDWKWFIILYILMPCHLFVAYWIEWGAARYAENVIARMKKEGGVGAEQIIKQEREKTRSLYSTWTAIAVSHGLNATFMLGFATYVVYYCIHNPGLGTLTELHAVVVWLKVCSYALANRDLRQAFLRSDAVNELPELYHKCPYPRNINFMNLCYFWWAPTLVYQPVYPRTERIRKDFVIKRFLEFCALCVLIWVTCAQYAVPLLHNSVDEIANLRGLKILERVMKLSTISLVCWLAGFFALFQSFLNLLAELLRFGDREFYSDWWNSSSVRSYWTSWNKPVTNFMKRHIYSPMVGRGVPPPLAQIIVFLFSGILHEALVGVPTHSILGVAFFGMIGQIPLIILTDVINKIGGNGPNAKLIGNCTFWLTFCIFGQPLAALAYFFAWQAKYGAGVQLKLS